MESKQLGRLQYHFVRLKNPADVATVEQQLQNYVAIQNKAKPDYKVAEYYLDPFQGMAIRAERDNTWNHWFAIIIF